MNDNEQVRGLSSEIAMEERGDVKPTRAGALFAEVLAAQEAERDARDTIEQRIDYYRGKYFGRDMSEVVVLVAIEEANRIHAENAGQRASEIVEGYEAMLAAQGRPLVRHGDVLARLHVETGLAFKRIVELEAFLARAKEAAKDPAAWSALGQELRA